MLRSICAVGTLGHTGEFYDDNGAAHSVLNNAGTFHVIDMPGYSVAAWGIDDASQIAGLAAPAQARVHRMRQKYSYPAIGASMLSRSESAPIPGT